MKNINLKQWMNGTIGAWLALLPLFAGAATTSGTVEIDPESQGTLVQDWGYDIKQVNKIDDVTPAYAKNLFIADRMSVLRVGIWGEDARPAHPGPGEIDTSYYVYDGTGGSLKVFDAMKNARDARPDITFFASKKLDSQTSFPAWVKNANGVIPEQYARMLADYLRFMENDTVRKSESFVIPILGIDNEKEYNEGNITPAKHLAIVTNLLAMSKQAGTVDLYDSTHATNKHVTVSAAFTMPRIIGPEGYSPSDTWVSSLRALSGGEATLDLLGTHYYPQHRPYTKLVNMLAAGNGRTFWNSEVHWDNELSDQVGYAEQALAAIFDNIDLGLSGFVWWSYSRTGFRGGMEQAITTSTIQGRQVAIDDQGGYHSPEIENSLITRAFRQGNTLQIWALNATGTLRNNFDFNLLRGEITGDVAYRRWIGANGTDTSESGFATVSDSNTFVATLPANSITLYTLPFKSTGSASVYALDGDAGDGTAYGGYSYVAGRRAQAMEFDGSDSYVSIPRNISDSFTIAFWVRADAPGGIYGNDLQWYQGDGLVDGEVAGAAGDFGVSLLGSNIAFGVGQPDTSLFSKTGMADGQWRHVAVTRNSWTGEMEMFINGKTEAHTFGPAGTKAAPPTLRLGCLQTGVHFFNGQLDDVRIFDRILEPSEIQDLAFFDASASFVETWESAATGAWVGTGNIQADNLWAYNGWNRKDWGVANVAAPLASKAFGVEADGTNISSTDADAQLPRTLDPEKTEWIRLQAKFMLNGTTTSQPPESRVYVVDPSRQNGYAVIMRSRTSMSPIMLRIEAGGVDVDLGIGAIGSQETDVVYDVTASFKRLSDSFTQVRYHVLKGGVEWQSGDAIMGGATASGSMLTKVQASHERASWAYIDDIAVTVQPDLRDFQIGAFDFQVVGDRLVMMVDVPELGTPYHVETSTNLVAFSAEPGTSFVPDVSPWRIELPLGSFAQPARFFRIKTGIEP